MTFNEWWATQTLPVITDMYDEIAAKAAWNHQQQRIAELDAALHWRGVEVDALRENCRRLSEENQRLRGAIQVHRASFINQEEGDIVPQDEILWAALEGGK